MAPLKLLVALNRLLWYQYPRYWALPRSTDSEETIVEPPSTKEIIMDVFVIIGILVSVFVGLAGLILFFPYDK